MFRKFIPALLVHQNLFFSKMSWSSQMEVHYPNHAMPSNSMGGFVDFFGGLNYDHGNFIFADAPFVQVHY